jgi:hypothetical protein
MPQVYGRHATQSGTVAPPPPAVPTWVSALAVGEWYEIPNTDIASVDPATTPSGVEGPYAKINDWCSLCVDQRTSKVYSIAGGGHAAYAGNEVDVLTLNTATPSWAEVLATTSNANLLNASYYSDGRPASRHHYYGLVCVEQDDRFMLLGGSRWSNGGITVKVDSYNISANSYNAAATHPDIPEPNATWTTGSGYLASITVQPSTGDIYLVSFGGGSKGNVCKWTRSTNTWNASLGSSGSTPPLGYTDASAWDTSRDQWFVTGTTGDGDCDLYTLGTNSWQQITPSGAGASAIREQQGAMFYSASLDKFLYRESQVSGGAVWQINPSTFAVTSFSTTGGASIPVPGDGTIGLFNRFLSVPALGGAILYPTHGGNAWFLRIE